MSDQATPHQAAVGFRVKSGWAAAVLLGGPLQTPRALDRRRIELSDADVPETVQPYHAAMGLLEEDGTKIRQRTKVVKRVAAQSVANLLEEFRAAGHLLRGAGLVVGSQIDPQAIANPPIPKRHAEGRWFRSVLVKALEAHGLPCAVLVEREAYARGAVVLARSEGDLKRAVADLGRVLGGPWRAEEKLAALAAWMS